MDHADIAEERGEVELERARKAAEANLEIPKGLGHCLWCGETLGDDRRWCDADCREDWERDRENRK